VASGSAVHRVVDPQHTGEGIAPRAARNDAGGAPEHQRPAMPGLTAGPQRALSSYDVSAPGMSGDAPCAGRSPGPDRAITADTDMPRLTRNCAHASRAGTKSQQRSTLPSPAGARSWSRAHSPGTSSTHLPAATSYRVCRMAGPIRLIRLIRLIRKPGRSPGLQAAKPVALGLCVQPGTS
jgi:hypothetical protein